MGRGCQENFKKMNSPAYDVLKASWPSYLVPTIDKYLRADIGRRTVSEELPLANAQTVNIDEQVLTYRSTPDGVLVADAEGLVALLVTDDVVGDGLADLELVPLSCSRFLVVGPTCITLFDLLTGVGAYVVRPRERDVKLRACRLSDSTFVVADMDLLMYQYFEGKVYGLRKWPLKMHQVVADRLVGLESGLFLAIRGNGAHVYDISRAPGLRSVSLEYRPKHVQSGSKWLLIAGHKHLDVYTMDLTLDHTVHVDAPITSVCELADGCVVTGFEKGLKVWKSGCLHHTYKLDFTPTWLSLIQNTCVASDGDRLYTFQ